MGQFNSSLDISDIDYIYSIQNEIFDTFKNEQLNYYNNLNLMNLLTDVLKILYNFDEILQHHNVMNIIYNDKISYNTRIINILQDLINYCIILICNGNNNLERLLNIEEHNIKLKNEFKMRPLYYLNTLSFESIKQEHKIFKTNINHEISEIGESFYSLKYFVYDNYEIIKKIQIYAIIFITSIKKNIKLTITNSLYLNEEKKIIPLNELKYLNYLILFIKHEKNNSILSQSKFDKFKEIYDKALDKFKLKSENYDDVFKEHGMIGLMINIQNNLKKCINVKKNYVNLIQDSNIEDILLDLNVSSSIALISLNES